MKKQGLRDVDLTDRLIAAVQARECLWDRTYRGHRNRFKLERYWNEVAQEVGTTPINCRKKWKNLKDQCRKEIKFHADDSDWAHFPKLKFIHNQFRYDDDDADGDTPEPPQFLDESMTTPKLGYTIRKKLLLSKRRNIEVDTEKLIELVQAKEIIWNRQLKGHHNWYKLDECWKEIAAELGATRDEARLKWKYVRDQTRKECRKTESEWPLLPKLQFLVNQFPSESEWPEDSAPRDSLSTDYPETADLNEEKTIEPGTMDTEINMNFETVDGIDDDYDEFDTKPVIRETDFNDDDGDFLSNPGTSQGDVTDYSKDEDVGFFNSLLPHIKQLGPAKKMMLRMKIQELVYNAVYQT